MSTLHDAYVWLNDPGNWRGPDGVTHLLVEHAGITLASVAIAAVVALPVALRLGHTGRGGGVTVVVSNISRAIPTLALLTVFSATSIGFGDRATIIALAVFAVPPLLANTYVGVRSVDPDVVEAATGMGLSGAQVLLRVRVPLALPLIAAGFRTAVVQVWATATLAALVGGGGLGKIINAGFALQRYDQVLAGGFLVALVALVLEVLLAGVQRSLTPGREHRRLLRRGGSAADAVEPLVGTDPVGPELSGTRT